MGREKTHFAHEPVEGVRCGNDAYSAHAAWAIE